MQIIHFLGHRYFYILGIAILLSGLGWSNFLMSLGQFVILGNWFFNIYWKAKFERLKNNPAALLLSGLFLIHLLGLLWTSDLDYGIHDIKIKLPLIALPIIIGSSAPINFKEWRILLGVYIGSLFLISLVSWAKYFSLFDYSIENKRELSVLISHIRYGLNLVWLTFLLFLLRKKFNKTISQLFFVLGIYFVLCLISFELISGLVCGFVATCILLLKKASRKDRPLKTRLITFSSLGGICIILFLEMYSVANAYYTPVSISYDQNEYLEFSPSGGKYHYDFESPLKENGIFIWRFVALDELETEWNKRSKIKYKDTIHNGGRIEQVLCRFLASKGLKKDSLGVASLTAREIQAIESGISNTFYLNHNVIENRIFRSIYEIDHYINYNQVDGFSVAMRLEYWSNTWQLIKERPLLGVGTGDIKNAIEKQYEKGQSNLSEVFQKRTHNQYLSIWLGMGLFAFIYLLLVLFYPAFIKGNSRNLVWSFLIIAGVSFITEDTLETQAGVTFFALFYSLMCCTPISFSKSK